MSVQFVIPGDTVDHPILLQDSKKPLRLGPGIQVTNQELHATVAGALMTEPKKNLVWIEQGSGRYVPAVGDLVIGTISRVAGDLYYVSLSDYTLPATLHNLAFENATKKTRPMLQAGAVIYAQVSEAQRYMDPEITCIHSKTGKADGLGPMTSGMLFNVSLGMARRLMLPKKIAQGKIMALEELNNGGVNYEIAVGRNGKVWVDSDKAAHIIVVGRALQELDEKNLDIKEQKKLVRRLLESLA